MSGDSRLEIDTLGEVCIDTSEWDFVGVPFCDRLPLDEGFRMELPLEEDVEDSLRLPGEGELSENFLLEDLREVSLEMLAEVRLTLPDEKLPLEGEHTLECSRDAELEVELSREEELTENSLFEDGLENAVRRIPKLEREFRLNPSVETD